MHLVLFFRAVYSPCLPLRPSLSVFCIITVISPVTRSDYTQPLLVITFYFKSTQPPDLPSFPLLFGSTVVIKMLPGSESLLSKMYFFFFTAPRNSNSAFLSCIPISPSHSFPLCFCPFLVLSPFAHDGVLIGSFSYLHTLCFHSAASPPDVITVGLTFKGIM